MNIILYPIISLNQETIEDDKRIGIERPSLYHFEDTWEHYDFVARAISERYHWAFTMAATLSLLIFAFSVHKRKSLASTVFHRGWINAPQDTGSGNMPPALPIKWLST